MSSETYREDPDSRVANMELVLDESEEQMVSGINTMVDSLIKPFVECKDWSMIAEWNFDSFYGCFSRHNEMCVGALDKTIAQTREATRDDVGTEISANKLEGLLFKNKVQNLNVRRSGLIVDTLEARYREVFEKGYVPKSKRGNATSDKKVDVVQKQFLKDQLKKLVG
jgi:hypothetical protein